jgi:hypothetical protein
MVHLVLEVDEGHHLVYPVSIESDGLNEHPHLVIGDIALNGATPCGTLHEAS